MGAYLISSLIGCTFIYQYNNFENYFSVDEVFIILIIPAIDMLRLFIVKILNKTHPFKGDLNHVHHIFNSYTKNKKMLFINAYYINNANYNFIFEYKNLLCHFNYINILFWDYKFFGI